MRELQDHIALSKPQVARFSAYVLFNGPAAWLFWLSFGFFLGAVFA